MPAKPVGIKGAWLRGRLRTARLQGVGWGEEVAGNERDCLRGRLWTAWVQGSGWKWDGEKKPLEIRELGCAHGCGRCGCKGVGGNGWGDGDKGVAGNGRGEEAAGDERGWLRGRLRTELS